MGRLPRRQRAVVVLRYFEDLTEARDRRAPRLLGRHREEPVSKALAKLRIDPALDGFPSTSTSGGSSRTDLRAEGTSR